MKKRVLVVKLSSIGDVLATTPLFRALDDAGYEVEHMVMEHCSMVTERNPHIAKVHTIPVLPSGSRIKDIAGMMKIYRVFREGAYDAVLVMHLSPLFQLLAKLAGVRRVIGFGNRMKLALDDFIMYRDRGINRTMQEFVLARLLEPGLNDPVRLEYYPKSEAKPEELGLPDRYIACNPGGAFNIHSAMPNRCWPVSHYIGLIKKLNMPVVLLGRGERDAAISREISAAVPEVTNLVGRTSFDETARVIMHAECYVGNDSALLFLAAALGMPTLGIFGPTPSEAANPIGPLQQAVDSPTRCAPCYVPFDGLEGTAYRCGDNLCMQEIGVEQVYEAVRSLLEQR